MHPNTIRCEAERDRGCAVLVTLIDSQHSRTILLFRSVHIDLSRPDSGDDTVFLNVAIDVTNPGIIGGSVSDG